MPQIVSCPECDKKLRVPDDLVGQKVRCPGCNGMFMAKVPGAGPRAEEPTRRAPPRAPVRDDAIEEGPRPGRAERRVSPTRRDDRDDYDEPRPRRRRDEEEDDYDDRPRSRRRRDEEEEDEDYPRSRRERYEDEDEDEGPAPRSVREGWRKVRSGINFVIISIWVMIGTIVLNICGTFAIMGAGVGGVSSSKTPGQATGAVVAAGSGLIALLLVVFVLQLVVTGLKLFGYAQCMSVPVRRGSSIKTLALVAFVLGGTYAVTEYGSQAINWARFGLVAAGANPFAALGAGGGIVLALSGLAFVAWIASFFVFCFFLRSVCLEVRKPGLAKTMVSFMIAIGVTVGIAVLLFILTLVIIGTAVFSALGGSQSTANALGGLMVVFVGLFCVLGLVALGLFVWYIVLLHQVRGAVDNHLYRTR